MKKCGKVFKAACLFAAGGFFMIGSFLNVARAQGTSETQAKGHEEEASVGVTALALRPTAGSVFYNGTQKFVGGALLDFNFLSTPIAKLGPSFGALYSSTTSGGFTNGVSTSNNQYIFQLPANLKLTIAPEPTRRLNFGVHGGANIIRTSSGELASNGVFGGTSSGSSANLGSSGGASWDVHPNVGGDIDFAMATNLDLSLRPDVTFMPGFDMTTLTLGLALQL